MQNLEKKVKSFKKTKKKQTNTNKCITIVNLLYRPSEKGLITCKNCLQDILSKDKIRNLTECFDKNLFKFENNKKTPQFHKLIISVWHSNSNNKKTARVSKFLATVMDHIITNQIHDNDFKSTVTKNNISHHYPFLFSGKLKQKTK